MQYYIFQVVKVLDVHERIISVSPFYLAEKIAACSFSAHCNAKLAWKRHFRKEKSRTRFIKMVRTQYNNAFNSRSSHSYIVELWITAWRF